jgi:hypothetical protein
MNKSFLVFVLISLMLIGYSSANASPFNTFEGTAPVKVDAITVTFTSSIIDQPKPVINEWMASNTTTIQDPADEAYDDWFELYNPGTQQVDISGYVLSDGFHTWTVPAGTFIAPENFLLVWADRQPEQNGFNDDLHADFKLSKYGDEILMSSGGVMVDYVSFSTQETDISIGRWPDAFTNIFRLGPATPREPNELPEPGIMIGLLLAGIMCLRHAR